MGPRELHVHVRVLLSVRALKLAVSLVAVAEFNSLYVAMKLYSPP